MKVHGTGMMFKRKKQIIHDVCYLMERYTHQHGSSGAKGHILSDLLMKLSMSSKAVFDARHQCLVTSGLMVVFVKV